jgi:NAD(P)-dependent dehydrogenase (short-subunit alcohol dehydrogenase family)
MKVVHEAARIAGSRRIEFVHLWSLDAATDNSTALAAVAAKSSATLIALARALDETGVSAGVSIVTRGAQAVGHSGPAGPLEIAQAALWGLARTLALEAPDRGWRRVDLDPVEPANEAGALAAYLRDPANEDQVSWRGGRAYALRLARSGRDVSSPSDETARAVVRTNGAYLVTGGTGGIGLQVADWLVTQGVRRIVLAARSEPAAAAAATIERLQGAGVDLRFVRADVATPAGVERMVADATAGDLCLRGVFHAAGVLDDAVVGHLEEQRVAGVMAPKVTGGWLLHSATQHLPLDHFVLFSSATALLGGPGQGAYSAANAALDALAHHRRALGLPAIAINWGPWADVGMASRAAARDQSRVAERGVDLLAPATGLEVLARLMATSLTQALVMSIRWRALSAAAAPPPMVADLVAADRLSQGIASPAGTGGVDVAPPRLTRAQVIAAGKSAPELVKVYVAERVAVVLGLQAQGLDLRKPITVMGLDSLMALELKNTFELDFDVRIALDQFLAGPSIEALAGTLLERVLESSSATGASASRMAFAATSTPTIEEGEI